MLDHSRKDLENQSANGEAYLADLAAERGDMVAIRKENLRKLLDFRSALAIARMAGLSQDTVCGDSGGGDGITVAELERLVQECEVEEGRVTQRLALVDTGIAQGTPARRGPLQ